MFILLIFSQNEKKYKETDINIKHQTTTLQTNSYLQQ